MKYNEILREHGQVRYGRTIRKVSNLADTVFGKNQWEFTKEYDSNTKADITGIYGGTKIGDLMFSEGCKQNKGNKAGYVYMVKDIFHEARHIQRYVTEWNTLPDGNKLSEDIIRRKLISFPYPSTYTNNYTNDPGEMDAEVYAIEKSLEYFESDLLVDKEEARTILFELMMSEDYCHNSIFEEHSPRSIDDILEILKERRETVADILYEVTDQIEPGFEDCVNPKTDLTKKFLYSDKFKDYRKASDACTTGTQRDKVLEQTLLSMIPDIAQYVKRLEPELLERKAQMQDKMRAHYMGLAEDEAVYPDEIENAEHDKEFADNVKSISDEDLKL